MAASWADAEKLATWGQERDALQREMEAITQEGYAYMDSHGGALPPAELQQRLVEAHAAWMACGRRMPLVFESAS